MVRTAIINTQYSKSGEIRIKDITSLKVFNAGNTIAIVAGFPVYPNQKEVIIVGDNTASNVIIELEFKRNLKEEEDPRSGPLVRFDPNFIMINGVKTPVSNNLVVIYKHII